MLKSKLSYTNCLCGITAAVLVARSYYSAKADQENELVEWNQHCTDHYRLLNSEIEENFHSKFTIKRD